MHDWNWDNWGMPMMWFIWIPILILVIWLIVRVANNNSAPISSGEQKESPLEILDRRYAEGEITKEEYEERRNTLMGKNKENEE